MLPCVTSATFAPSRRARASACITSKPVGPISTTGTETRVFRYAPFEPPAITTSGRPAPAASTSRTASSKPCATMRRSARSTYSPAISKNRSRRRLMLSAQMRGRWAVSKRGVLKAGRLAAGLEMSVYYARIHF
ncbi:protein of unknown function [Paraburkholderia dioscoreae]|uniref:Uncharacterized protein n=1 Tax=Paraburkholderia dioscoreae TaxID=2604047 RepID=A0A5Q4ZB78_9BURK|nr:protein of unknown function [Paraburkholderia dioscoreae]